MPADHSVQCYEDCHPSALSSIDEPLARKMDGAYEPERYDAQSVRAIGHVFGQDEELERGQWDGGPVTRQNTDEACYGDGELLQPHKNKIAAPPPLCEPKLFCCCLFTGVPRSMDSRNFSLS